MKSIRMFNSAYVILMCVICEPFLIDALSVGDACKVARSGAQGECKVIHNCQTVFDEIVKKGLFPNQCGFMGRDQIVCCPIPVNNVITSTTSPVPTRISQRKCREYENATYETVWTSVGSKQKPVLQKILRCATSNVPLIEGGDVANLGEFPHMALIGYERTFDTGIVWGCGGSLISEDFVLTAAHCVETSRYEGTPKYVLLGEHDLSNDKSDRPLQIEIAENIPHPNYKRSAKYYDIALVRLSIRITFNHFMRPACLPETYNTAVHNAIATGWGRTGYRNSTSKVLMKVDLELFPEDECNTTHLDASQTKQLRYGILPEQQLCAGSHTAKKNTCQGDSGGPLQVHHPYIKCMYTVVGITSFGEQCGNLNAPGVYTRVYNFLDWIENIVWPNQ